MTALPFAPILGLFHCARGRDELPRWAFFMLAGLLAFFETGSLLCGIATTACIAFWLGAGWGNGLIAVTGRDTRDANECPTLYWLTSELVPNPTAGDELRRWGAVFMALRGCYLIPLFIAYALLLTPWAPAFGLLCPLQGVVYYACGKLMPERYAVACAEMAWGTILGLLIAACGAIAN